MLVGRVFTLRHIGTPLCPRRAGLIICSAYVPARRFLFILRLPVRNIEPYEVLCEEGSVKCFLLATGAEPTHRSLSDLIHSSQTLTINFQTLRFARTYDQS